MTDRTKSAALSEAEGMRGSLVVVRPGKPVGTNRIEAAERALGTRLPAGLRTFWTRHGAVELGESSLRVLPPERVVEELASWRDLVATAWSDAVPSPAERTCIRVAEHDDASSVFFRTSEPDRLFALDRDGEEARELGLGFVPALLAFSEAPTLLLLGMDEPLVRLAFEGEVPVADVVVAIRASVTLDRDEEHEDGWEGCSAELRGVLTIDGDDDGCRVDLELGPSFPLSTARRALGRATKALEALGLQRLS
ncbi:MAG: SMI1/KNR4 family protein [Sandaracinus sp.]|nr:SMI1/KNR4 family protein [Sandaracinus sp.]MCB9623664.1 SMI1/KNR4 family protein [Sandaracinus sp.]MCB9630683.1 SMI1/KNR4 family protein [Sandaracinus sp.]